MPFQDMFQESKLPLTDYFYWCITYPCFF